MIGRILVDKRQYEIELFATHATVRRLEPPGERLTRSHMNDMYDFAAGKWYVCAVARLIRQLELQGLFDVNKPASAGNGSTP